MTIFVLLRRHIAPSGGLTNNEKLYGKTVAVFTSKEAAKQFAEKVNLPTTIKQCNIPFHVASSDPIFVLQKYDKVGDQVQFLSLHQNPEVAQLAKRGIKGSKYKLFPINPAPASRQ